LREEGGKREKGAWGKRKKEPDDPEEGGEKGEGRKEEGVLLLI